MIDACIRLSADPIRISGMVGTDSYKGSHHPLYPSGAEFSQSYFGGRRPAAGIKNIIAYQALNYHLPRTLKPVTMADFDEAQEIYHAHFVNDTVFNKGDWRKLIDLYGGQYPISVSALPEGLPVPADTMLLRVENTVNKLAWLPNHLETKFSHQWYPATVCSISRAIRTIILRWLIKNGTPEEIDFKLHDFGYRAVSGDEQAMIGGSAHMVNFKGTDTPPALKFAHVCYGLPYTSSAFSIPATEHSTICSWGKEHEGEAYDNLLNTYPTNMIACVSDSYNIVDACDYLWGQVLRDKVLSRHGVLVIRPDSGDPLDVTLRVLNILGNRFGFTVNAKGYKVLNPKVRMIWGDGIDMYVIDKLLKHLDDHRWSADNIAFGMGSALLQKCNRDTFSFSFKMCWIAGSTDGRGWERDVYKSPAGDPGKVSRIGRQVVVVRRGKIVTIPERERCVHEEDLMRVVYHYDGFKKEPRFDNLDIFDVVRARALALDAEAWEIAA